MQNKLTQGRLLDANGHLQEPGWHTRLVREYRRQDIRAGKLRIKEWDYYLIEDGENVLCLTLDDNSYMGMISATLIHRPTRAQTTQSIIIPFTMGKTNFPSTSEKGDVELRHKNTFMRFANDGKMRTLECHYENFKDGKNLDVRVYLAEPPQDSMVIATPFAEKKTAFYYNQKIIGMTAEGRVTLGDETFFFDKKNSRACWTGAAAFGHMTIHGSGPPPWAPRTAIASASTWATASAIPPPPAKICCSWTAFATSSARSISAFPPPPTARTIS